MNHPMTPDEEYEFYARPENQEPQGPGRRRLPGGRHRQGHRAVQTAASPPGVPGVPQTPGPRLSGSGTASGHGQLRRPQKAAGARLAGRKPPRQSAFHAHIGVVDEPRRGLVFHHRTPCHPPRHLPQRRRADRGHQGLNQRLEPARTPGRLDQDPRANPRQSTPPNNFKHAALDSA